MRLAVDLIERPRRRFALLYWATTDSEKVPLTMRKNSLFYLGAITGTCLTLLATGPRSDFWIAAAKAAVISLNQRSARIASVICIDSKMVKNLEAATVDVDPEDDS